MQNGVGIPFARAFACKVFMDAVKETWYNVRIRVESGRRAIGKTQKSTAPGIIVTEKRKGFMVFCTWNII